MHILDARDPLGTRCRSVEKYIKEEAPHKHLIFVLNKCDLVPTSVAVSSPFTAQSHFPYSFIFRLLCPRHPIVQVKAATDHTMCSFLNGGRLLQLWESNTAPDYIASSIVLVVERYRSVRFGHGSLGDGECFVLS